MEKKDEVKATQPTPAGGTSAKNRDGIRWPSERVHQGGFFHTHRVVYNQETADLLKLLLEESRLSTMMRRRMNYHLRSDSAPPVKPKRSGPIASADSNTQALQIIAQARNEKRKSAAREGAPRPSLTTLQPRRRPRPKAECDTTAEDIINELMEQIKERAEWLAELDQMGQGERYREEVREQIAERLRQIRDLEMRSLLIKKGIRYVE